MLWGIWGADVNNVWAVGLSGVIRKYNGTSWSAQTSGTSNALYGIWGADANNIWAVGQNGTILKYDGASWSAQPSGTTKFLYCVQGSNGVNIWAGSNSGTVHKFDGATWTEQEVPPLLPLWGIAIVGSEITAVGVFGTVWHSADQPLPVELLHFRARRNGSSAALQWQTATERNNAGFHIERSDDARNFQHIGFVAGQGSSVQMQDYHFMDNSPLPGLNYYRLRQTDYDGAFSYSPIVSVLFEENDWQVFPNPTTGLLEISGPEHWQETSYRLTDQLGRTVRSGPLSTRWLDMDDLPAGLVLACSGKCAGPLDSAGGAAIAPALALPQTHARSRPTPCPRALFFFRKKKRAGEKGEGLLCKNERLMLQTAQIECLHTWKAPQDTDAMLSFFLKNNLKIKQVVAFRVLSMYNKSYSPKIAALSGFRDLLFDQNMAELLLNGHYSGAHAQHDDLGDLHQSSTLDTPLKSNAFALNEADKIELISNHFEKIMDILGLDLNDDSLRGTPRRVAKMYVNEIFRGLNPRNKPAITTFDNKYQYRCLVIERNIPLQSTCEHHFQPIFGVAHVAYVPNGKVIGLSKLNRIVDYYARRPQVQERLIMQIANELKTVLQTEDVAVYIDAKHMCVQARGVEHHGASTITAEYSGKFLSDTVKREFLSAIGMPMPA